MSREDKIAKKERRDEVTGDLDKFLRLMIGTAVGFLGGKLVDEAYNRFILDRRLDDEVEDESAAE